MCFGFVFVYFPLFMCCISFKRTPGIRFSIFCTLQIFKCDLNFEDRKKNKMFDGTMHIGQIGKYLIYVGSVGF